MVQDGGRGLQLREVALRDIIRIVVVRRVHATMNLDNGRPNKMRTCSRRALVAKSLRKEEGGEERWPGSSHTHTRLPRLRPC